MDSYSLQSRAERYRELQRLASDLLANPPLGSSPYGYTPSKGVCITAIVLFSISTALHTAQAVYYSIRRRKAARLAGEADDGVGGERRGREPSYWWILVTLVPGGLLEIIGWTGRYWSSQNVLNIEVCAYSQLGRPLTLLQPFLMQITTYVLNKPLSE